MAKDDSNPPPSPPAAPSALLPTGWTFRQLPPAPPSPLSSDETPPEAWRFQSLWHNILRLHDPEAAFGSGQKDMPAHTLAQWRNLSAAMRTVEPVTQLQYINGFFNRNVRSASDKDIYCAEEYWARPEEFLLNRAGDCEDYAVAKYLALRYFGWPAGDMWIILVKDRARELGHAVLAVKLRDTIFTLDNLSRPPQLLLREDIFLKNFIPLYAFNECAFWTVIRPEAPETEQPDASKKPPTEDGT